MKKYIQTILLKSLASLTHGMKIPDINIQLESCKHKDHGDYASNIAMVLVKTLKENPRKIAKQLIDHLPDSKHIKKVEVAGPGFINFFLNQDSQFNIIADILNQKQNFGAQQITDAKHICIEFVSANPTGPLHVGHGRGAAYGDSLVNLLRTLGHKVHSEYYVNDAGRQMDILATSVWLRYLSLINENDYLFPVNGYQGDYIWDIAAYLHRTYRDKFNITHNDLYKSVHPDEPKENGDKEKHIDDLINKAKEHLGDNYNIIFNYASDTIINNIKDDLSRFGVTFDSWFSEKNLNNETNIVIKSLQEKQIIYQKNAGLWFRSTDYGDEKDRVVVRSNGLKTYFASDIAYHKNKIERGFDTLIDIWGADHHGYVSRVTAGMTALGLNADRLKVLLVQFANLFRSGVPVKMSTRSGSFVTLAELCNEVGSDAARFFYVARKSEQHLDFDLDLAKAKNSENPVYYIQYAHARIFRILEKLDEKNLSFNEQIGLQNLALLTSDIETELIKKLNNYSEMLKSAGENFAPHQITTYLRELAHSFHRFYNTQQILIDDKLLRNARICLMKSVAQIIKNALKILGVSAPENM